MKVETSQRSAPAKATSKSGAGRGAGATGAVFSPNLGRAETTVAGGVTGLSSITMIDSLLAVQGLDGLDNALTGKRRAVKNASETLDILDDIKLGLLVGDMPTGKLQDLVERVRQERDALNDPDLENLLDHIELRARVELAKFGQKI